MYAKIFSQIFDSSIADDYELRHFFMDLLVLADSDGVVDMTQQSISARTRIPLEKVKAHLVTLCNADVRSRTPTDDGRRIRLLDDHRDWGWLIINYDKFRNIASDMQRREATRLRVQRHREKIRCNADVTPCNACVTPPYASVSAYQESSERRSGGKPDVASFKAWLLKVESTKRSLIWPQDEEQLIAEFVGRTGLREEQDELAAYKERNPKFFPRSIRSLLQNWDKTLDEARQPTIQVNQNGKPVTSLLDQQMDSFLKQAEKLK